MRSIEREQKRGFKMMILCLVLAAIVFIVNAASFS